MEEITWHDIDLVLISTVVVRRIDNVIDKSDVVASRKRFSTKNFSQIRKDSVVREKLVDVEKVSNLFLNLRQMSDKVFGVCCKTKGLILRHF